MSDTTLRRLAWMCFAGIRLKTKCRLKCGPRQGQARRTMVMAHDVKEIIYPNKLAIGLEKRWVSCHRLVQQVNGLE